MDAPPEQLAERGVLSAPDAAWEVAVQRAAVIGRLAQAERVTGEAADAAAAELGISRRRVYALIRRWREGSGLVTDLIVGRSDGGRGGGRLQAVMRPDGLPIWVGEVEPGSVHDLTCAQEHALGALYAAAARGLPTLADPGYDGAGIGIHVPFKQPTDGRRLGVDNRTYNKLLRAMRALGERGFALLAGRWRVLQHVTASPNRIGQFAKAALVLTHFEHGYLPR